MNISDVKKENEEIVLTAEILRETRRRMVKSLLDVIVLAKLNEGSAHLDI